MNQFYMFLCDTCGYSQDKPGICRNCQAPLTMYSKEAVADFQNYVKMEDAMRSMSEYKWYV